jgi:hypothetical protein
MFPLMGSTKKDSMKNRTVRWPDGLHELAIQLAAELGYYPERRNGGVSKMLSDLVLQEAKKSQAEGNVIPIPAPDAKPSRRSSSATLKRSSG